MVGATFDQITQQTPLFDLSGSSEIAIPAFNATSGQEPANAVF